jgi:hypothetical protein
MVCQNYVRFPLRIIFGQRIQLMDNIKSSQRYSDFLLLFVKVKNNIFDLI